MEDTKKFDQMFNSDNNFTFNDSQPTKKQFNIPSQNNSQQEIQFNAPPFQKNIDVPSFQNNVQTFNIPPPQQGNKDDIVKQIANVQDTLKKMKKEIKKMVDTRIKKYLQEFEDKNNICTTVPEKVTAKEFKCVDENTQPNGQFNLFNTQFQPFPISNPTDPQYVPPQPFLPFASFSPPTTQPTTQPLSPPHQPTTQPIASPVPPIPPTQTNSKPFLELTYEGEPPSDDKNPINAANNLINELKKNQQKASFGTKPNLTVDLPPVLVNSSDPNANTLVTYLLNALKSVFQKPTTPSYNDKHTKDEVIADVTFNADILDLKKNNPNSNNDPHKCCMINLNMPVIHTAESKAHTNHHKNDYSDHHSNHHHHNHSTFERTQDTDVLNLQSEDVFSNNGTCFGHASSDEAFGLGYSTTFFDDIKSKT